MSETKYSAATPLQPRRRAILIGASSGIGAALARRLAREGYQMALLARREEQLKSLCEQINRESGEPRAFYYVHDVTAYDQVPGLLQHILEDLGGLDLFIYNTGINIPVKRTEFNFETDRQMLETNLLGALAWLNPVAAMFQSLKAGQIVGIGSVAGDRGRVGAPAYNTSKAGLHTYLEALRNRLARSGVAVLTVKPGFVNTSMLKSASTNRPFLVTPVEIAVDGIWKAIRARKQTVYISGLWGLMMLIIRHIPSVIFRRLSF